MNEHEAILFLAKCVDSLEFAIVNDPSVKDRKDFVTRYEKVKKILNGKEEV